MFNATFNNISVTMYIVMITFIEVLAKMLQLLDKIYVAKFVSYLWKAVEFSLYSGFLLLKTGFHDI